MPRRLLAGILILVALFVVSAWPTLPSMVDDAYVSLRYARNLALGHGLVFNAGEPPVEGYTNFLWVLWMAPGTVLPVHPSTWATGWGLAFGACALVCAAGVGTVLCGRSPWALLPAAILAPLPVFAIAATNGLETAMYLAVLLAATWALLDGRRPALGGALAGLLYLVRPEGIAAAGVLVVIAGWRALRGDTAPGATQPAATQPAATQPPSAPAPTTAVRRALTPLAALLAVVVPYFAARTAYFGTLGPNTFAAQARKPLLEMFEMNAGYYERSAGLFAGAALLFVLAVVTAAYTARRGVGHALPRLALLAIAAGLALVAMRVYNWMPGARLFLAPIALVACAVAPAVQSLPRVPRALAAVAIAGWVGWLSLGPSRAAEARYDARNTALPRNQAERMGRAIAAMAPPGTWLLARDAGVVPYFAGPAVNVIDIHPYSLTDPRLTGKRFDVDYVLGHDAPFLVTTATTPEELPTIYAQERTLLGDRRVKGRYRQVSVAKQHYRRWYALWVRDDVAPPAVADPAASPGPTPATPAATPGPTPADDADLAGQPASDRATTYP